jgi:hypothetical protein
VQHSTKRHVLTDQKGIPLSVVVITEANNTHDMKAAIETLDSFVIKMLSQMKYSRQPTAPVP